MQVFACIITPAQSTISWKQGGYSLAVSTPDIDKVFKALAAPGRRHLLDSLYRHNGQTLSELCEDMEMTRQTVTQHLQQLEEANLVSIVWRGRTKLHYLNPIPLHEIHTRWIRKFEHAQLDTLNELKQRLEEDDNGKA